VEENNTYGHWYHCVQQIHHVQALSRSIPFERLVEQQHVGLMHECGRDPDALPHALE